jgi:Fe-S-cluster containining protein
MGHNICKRLCCQDFILLHSPEELKKLNPKNYQENDKITKIQQMVEYLGYYSFNKDVIKEEFRNVDADKAHHYKCTLQDPQTGLCKEYKDRPNMCIKYPNGHTCIYEGCEHN